MAAIATERASLLDVLVVAYDSRDEIGACVEAASGIGGVREVVVVDHGSDGSAAAARDAGARVLEDPSNPGFGAGQNRALAATGSPYVLVLNPDARPDPDGVAKGVAFLDWNPDVAIVQGVVISRRTGEPERSQGRELGPLHLLGRAVGARRVLRSRAGRSTLRLVPSLRDHVERRPAHASDVDALAATAWLARRDALESVGGFDRGYFLYGEDLDLCRRLRAKGWRLVALPDRWATHIEGSSASSPIERELTWWDGTMRFAARWWGRGAWSVALAAGVVRFVTLTARHPRDARRTWNTVVAFPFAERRVSRPSPAPASR